MLWWCWCWWDKTQTPRTVSFRKGRWTHQSSCEGGVGGKGRREGLWWCSLLNRALESSRAFWVLRRWRETPGKQMLKIQDKLMEKKVKRQSRDASIWPLKCKYIFRYIFPFSLILAQTESQQWLRAQSSNHSKINFCLSTALVHTPKS